MLSPSTIRHIEKKNCVNHKIIAAQVWYVRRMMWSTAANIVYMPI